MGMFDDWFDKTSNDKDKEESREVDKYPHLTALVDPAREYLQGKERVSLPELQLHFGISFSDVKILVDILQQNSLLIGKITGLSYKVNSRVIACTDLEYDDILYIGAALRKQDIDALSRFKNASVATEAKRSACANLIKEGVIFEAEGHLFLSYGKTTVESLKALSFSEEEWFIEKAVAECLTAAYHGSDILPMLESAYMISPEITNAVRERLPELKKSGKAPRPIRRTLKLESLKFQFIENAIKHYDFDNAEAYFDAVRSEIEELKAAGLDGTDTVAVMNIALREMRTLSIKSIKEVKAVIDDSI